MSEQQPLTPAGNGEDRGRGGRFAPGNRAGRGNPLNRKAQRLRSAVLRAATAAEVKQVMQKLVKLAVDGDVAAAKLWLERLLGPPVQADLLDRIESLEEIQRSRV